MNAATGRPRPCASCPYRLNAPTGLWHPDELDKLVEYDRPTAEQPAQSFACHHTPEHLCAGWLGHADPTQLLALRLGVSNGTVDPSCFDYETTAELHPTGAAAREHGMQDRDPRSLKMLAGILLDRPEIADDLGIDL